MSINDMVMSRNIITKVKGYCFRWRLHHAIKRALKGGVVNVCRN